MDNQGNVLLDEEQIKDHWKKYLEKTFNDDRKCNPLNVDYDTWLLVTQEEVVNVIKGMKDGKSPGPDHLYSEFLKIIDDN